LRQRHNVLVGLLY